MIKPEQVPRESLVAYQRAFKNGGGPADGIVAAINAWPGMSEKHRDDHVMLLNDTPALILPLPQEASDD